MNFKKGNLMALTVAVLMGMSTFTSVSADEEIVFNNGCVDGISESPDSDFVKQNVWDKTQKVYTFTKNSILNTIGISSNKAKVSINAKNATLTINSQDSFGIQSNIGRDEIKNGQYPVVFGTEVIAKKININVDRNKKNLERTDAFGIVSSSNGQIVSITGDVNIDLKNKFYKGLAEDKGNTKYTKELMLLTSGIAVHHQGKVVVNGNVDLNVSVPDQNDFGGNSVDYEFVHGLYAGINYEKEKPAGSIQINGDVNIKTDGNGIVVNSNGNVMINGGGNYSK